MHPMLENMSIFDLSDILKSNEKVLQLLTDLEVIPSRDGPAPLCPKCRLNMQSNIAANTKFGFVWKCLNKTNNVKCGSKLYPSSNTVFANVKFPVQDFLAAVIGFVLKWPVTFVLQHISSWRRLRKEQNIANTTVTKYYAICKEVAEIHASHLSRSLGGLQKTIVFDKDFVTKRQYGQQSVAGKTGHLVVGIVCKEDKDGVYFKLDSKRKRDLLPFVKERCHPESKFVRTDVISKTRQEFSNSKRHCSKYKVWYDQMAMRFYRRVRLKPLSSDGEKVEQFLKDLGLVYPGYEKTKLELLTLDSTNSVCSKGGNAEASATVNSNVGSNENIDSEDSSMESSEESEFDQDSFTVREQDLFDPFCDVAEIELT